MISVVIPVFNERESLPVLHKRLVLVLEGLADAWELLFVDDGSDDGSADILDELHRRDPRIKVIHFSRNFGHQAALQAGLDAATGSCVALMDADLQDPPEVLCRLIERWRSGYQVVYAVRKGRKEGLFKRTAYALFYRSMRAIAEVDVPVDAGDFCLLDRSVVDVLTALPERGRFLRGLRSWIGFRQIGVEYERDVRHAGEPKYTLGKLVRLALSGYIGFSTLPLRLASLVGVFSAAVGFLLALWAVVVRVRGIPAPWGWASTVAIILFMGGVQLLVLGIIGEYLGRMYDEVRRRPTYIVSSRVGFEAAGPDAELNNASQNQPISRAKTHATALR